MVGAHRGRALAVDPQLDRVADRERALGHLAEVHEQIAQLLLGVGDGDLGAVGAEHPPVADLAAGLAVERRLVDDDGDVAGRPRRFFDLLPVDDDGQHLAFGGTVS